MTKRKVITKEKAVNIARSTGYFHLHRYRSNTDAVRAIREAVKSGELEYAGYWLSCDHYRIPQKQKATGAQP